MTLEDLGYQAENEQFRKENHLLEFEIGRVIVEHKERYLVKTAEHEYEAEILGNLRFTAQSRADFPAVGDWVALSVYDTDKALIHSVFPRKSSIERQTVGKKGEKQIIATNIDYALIVLSVDRDFSINRIERYLTICYTSAIEPIIVLSKVDLITELELTQFMEAIQTRIPKVPTFAVSNETQWGISELKAAIQNRKTYCLLGSSGVGKSTLLNTILGTQAMKTQTISESTQRGRHMTTHRELHITESGGILIDNPGMREVGITDASGGLEITFDRITELAEECKFKDCTHTTETGCAVLQAIENGELDHASYNNYLKMQREKEHFESTVAEKRRKDKTFGKMMKNYKKTNPKGY
ncbi:ribosome small subunit-dependent GTPase A [bacterium]|nr:MAG: ribosome small subunit-dependent GTPase A [bacterium]